MSEIALISIAECARQLTAQGDKITSTGLAKYVKKHNLARGQLGRAKLVSLSEVVAARDSFTREVMRGETNPSSKNFKSAGKAAPKKRPSKKLKVVTSKKTPPPTPDKKIIPEDHLDRARAAKATREEIELESRALDLAAKKGELIPTSEVEAAFVDAMSQMKSHFLGPNLPRASERICVVLGLPDTKKRQTEDILRDILAEGLTTFGNHCTKSLKSLTPEGLPDRLAALNALAEKLYAQPTKASQSA